VKRPGREVDNIRPSGSEVKKEWSCTSSLPLFSWRGQSSFTFSCFWTGNKKWLIVRNLFRSSVAYIHNLLWQRNVALYPVFLVFAGGFFLINSGFDLTPLQVEFVLEKTDADTVLSPRTSVSLYQYNSTSASYSHFIHLQSTPRNDNNLQHRWMSTSVYSSVFPLSVKRLAFAMKRECVLYTVGIEFFQHACHGDEFQPV